MDITSLYYFTEVAKDLHITQTANRLYISQQTLSNHIKRLENYYDITLLNRKPTLSLTYAGEQVLHFAQEILRTSENLKDKLNDIRKEERGVLLFGSSRFRMDLCLPSILDSFSKRYPNVEIRITDANSNQLEKLVLDGEIDLAIVISVKDNSQITKIPLMSDHLYLCVTDTLLKKYYGEDLSALKNKAMIGTNIKDFAKLPFCMLNNRMGQKIQKCFDDAHVEPNVYTTSRYLQITTSIGLLGLAACFATQTSLLNQKGNIPEDINIFPLYDEGEPLTQEIYLIHHKDRYISQYNQYFLELSQDYFKEIEASSLSSIII